MTKLRLAAFSVVFLVVLCLSTSALEVFGQTAVPVPNASVTASGVNTSSSGSAISDTQGRYSITTWLDTDTYAVTASAVGFIDTTVSNIAVTAGAETPNVNILMPVSGGISGKVTDATTSASLSAVITAINATGGSNSGFAITDSNGNYQMITNLATGTYNVTASFVPGYVDKTINSVSVTSGVMTPNVNFALARSGAITGTITDSVSNAVQTGVSVEAIDSNGRAIAFGSTNSSGKYLLNTNLITGTYNVTVLFPTNHLSKTVSGVAVTAGSQTITNIAIDPSGIISGRITSGGQGLSNASVSAFSSNFAFFGSATTDSNGNYQITTGLGTGSYTVTASYQTAFGTSLNVNVVAGQTTPNVNVALVVSPTGSIIGTVTSSAGGGVSSAYVNAIAVIGTSTSNYTDASGNYVISGLAAGSYNVSASATGYTSASQNPVIVTVNTITTGVNLQLTPKASGRISGLIQTQGTPLPTSTPVPTTTPTPTPTVTPTPTQTITPTPTPTATLNPTPTPTQTSTSTPTSTTSATPKPTTSASPTTRPTSSVSPSPTIPEFSVWPLILLVLMVFSASLLAISLKSIRIRQQNKTIAN